MYVGKMKAETMQAGTIVETRHRSDKKVLRTND